jgi:hypothetical protein
MLRWQLVAGGDANFGSSSTLKGRGGLSIFGVLVFLLEG